MCHYRLPDMVAALTRAFSEARQICRLWSESDSYADHRTRRTHALLGNHHGLGPNDVLDAASYPETIALTSLLASRHWRGIAGSKSKSERDQFCAEVSRRIGQPYHFTGTHDLMARWIREQQRLPISPHAIEW